MPELPEVETWRRLAEAHVAGKRIDKVYAKSDATLFDQQSPATFARRQKDRTIQAVHRRGKHLWFELDQGPAVYVHFGMTGSFHIYHEVNERPRFLKAEWQMEEGARLGYVSIRKIGRLRLYSDIWEGSPIAVLGPDPLIDGLDPADFRASIQRRKAPIKSLLLDQKMVAGVGNWIADEILYQASINPHTRGNELSTDQIAAIRRVLLRIIQKAVDVQADAQRFPKTWLFHHRWGKTAGAKTAGGEWIQFDTIGGRTTAWCPARQRGQPRL